GIASSPEGEVGFRIVRTGHPDRRPATLPGITGPRFVSKFARTRRGIEAPDFLAGIHVPRCDPSANAEFAARSSRDDLVFDHKWRCREALSLFGISCDRLPEFSARLRIDRDQFDVVGRQEQGVA